LEAAAFVQRMAAGERERRAVMFELFPQLSQQTLRACRKYGLYRTSDADDVLQDVCVVVLTKWHTFHRENSLWGWVGAITRNSVIDVHRRRGRLFSLDQAQEAEGGAPPLVAEPASTPDHAHEDCVARVLAKLNSEGPARTGSIRTLDMIEFIVDCGTNTSALAEFLGCSDSAAKERKRYALHKFRELCVEFCGSDECAATVSG
jgi:RNA polymerase sigma factor (sigma-70 family)